MFTRQPDRATLGIKRIADQRQLAAFDEAVNVGARDAKYLGGFGYGNSIVWLHTHIIPHTCNSGTTNYSLDT